MGHARGITASAGKGGKRNWTPSCANVSSSPKAVLYISNGFFFRTPGQAGNIEGANQNLAALQLQSPTNAATQAGNLTSMTGALVGRGMPGPMAQLSQSSYPPPIQQFPARPTNPDEPIVPTNGFSTHEEAEKAFWYLLKKNSVNPNSTWEDTIRAIITDPLYRSFNSMAERKESWQKVCTMAFY